MTYNFEEPEFPNAPKLDQFGLVPEDYDRLKELNAEVAPFEKAERLPLSVYFWRSIGNIVVLLLVLTTEAVIESMDPVFKFLFRIFALYLVGEELRKKSIQNKIAIWLDRRTGPQIQARKERIRARAPELVQRRDDLLVRITVFENAHSNFFRDKALTLAKENPPISILATRKLTIVNAYDNALKHYCTEKQSRQEVLDYLP